MSVRSNNGLYRSEEKLYFWHKPLLRQTFVVFGVMTLTFSAGMGLGTATVMMPQLKKTQEILIDDDMASWIYAAHGFGSIPASIFIPILNKWRGYKMIFMLICIIIFSSFVMQYFATTAVHILLATIFQGMAFGGNLTLGLGTLCEYSDPRLRGVFLIIKSASYFWGMWIANVMGTFFDWRYIPLLAIWPLFFSISSCFIWPEGPFWLARKGKIEECKKSFTWLRGPGNDLEELSSIIENQAPNNNESIKGTTWSRMRKTLKLRQFYMPLFVSCTSFGLYYFSGKIVCAIYALVIIKEITKDESTAYTGMIIIDGVTVIGMYIGSYVAMKVKRRTMFLSTSAVTILFLYILSAYLSLVEYRVITQNAAVSLSLLIMYSFSVSWGPISQCTSVLHEVAPLRFKYSIVGISSTVFWLFHIITLKLAPIFFNCLGIHGSFAVYGTLSLMFWILLYRYLPETRNKTLQELEFYFAKEINKIKATGSDRETVLQDLVPKL